MHLLGYCMGGTMAALFTALRPELVRTLTLLAAPIDFVGHDALLNLWTDPRHFDVDGLVDAYGNCPAWFLQTCFLPHEPRSRNLIEKNISFYEQMDDPRSMTNHFALENWVNDNIPVAGETFREFVKNLYQRNLLVKGELSLGGRRVDLARITCPLLLLDRQERSPGQRRRRRKEFAPTSRRPTSNRWKSALATSAWWSAAVHTNVLACGDALAGRPLDADAGTSPGRLDEQLEDQP